MPPRGLSPGMPCRSPAEASARDRFDTGSRQSCHVLLSQECSVEGPRAKGSIDVPFRHARMPLEYLWAGSPCRRPVRSPLRHAGMPLEYLWAGSPCRRPSRSPLRHERIPLKHLWARSPCRRPVRSPPSPRQDAPEAPVGMVPVPKRSVGSGAGGASYLFSIGMYSLSSVTQR